MTSPTMSDAPPRTLRLRVDADTLAANWRALDAMSGAARAGAAVKANCYGLGVDQCLPALRDAGACNFYVAHWSEVAAVAAHIDPANISVLHGPNTAEEASYAKAIGARPVINSLHQAAIWNESGGGGCDLMVDTGINRLGLAMDEIGDPVVAALTVNTLMSHLASADDDCAANALQLSRFEQVVQSVPAKNTSLANSAGIALGSDYAFDLTRPGLALYGGVPREELGDAIGQVAFPQAAIIQCRRLSTGDSVGYNHQFTADRAMRVGVVSLGYADGFLRIWGGKGALAYNGKLLKLLGKVSMDMVVVDLTDTPDVKEGDWLDVPYHLPDAAQQSGLSQYELLTVLGDRFAR